MAADDSGELTAKPAQRPARPASLRSAIDPFIVMEVMREAAAREATGANVIHMEVGQPATPAPRAALDRVRRALDGDTLGYTLALGTDALRERIARHCRELHGIALDPSRVVVTTGSSAAFLLAFLAVLDLGDRLALPAPGYPCYRHILTALGGRPAMLETTAEARWMPLPAQVEGAAGEPQGLKGLLLASPSNPTGTMLEPDRLASLCAVCDRLGIWFISDEIYHGLTYDRPAETALKYSPNAIIINSFSKYFSMTGWRVGWMVVPEALVRPVERLAQNLYISPPAVSQVAALGAFDGIEELEANKAVYRANHDLLLSELPKAGFTNILPADGAFYLYADIAHLTDDSFAFAQALLQEAGVAATPGIDFDSKRGRRYLRLSYAGSTADMAEGAKRIAAWMSRRRR